VILREYTSLANVETNTEKSDALAQQVDGNDQAQMQGYQDHVLDSIPSDPGLSEFSALWLVFLITPANSLPATQAAYAARLPMTSEAAVDAAVAAGVAREVDTGSYFLCSIVNAHAAR
jgi:hypothetical protein